MTTYYVFLLAYIVSNNVYAYYIRKNSDKKQEVAFKEKDENFTS